MKEKEAVDLEVAPPRVVEAYRRHREELVRFAAVLVGPDDAQDVVSCGDAAAARPFSNPSGEAETVPVSDGGEPGS